MYSHASLYKYIGNGILIGLLTTALLSFIALCTVGGAVRTSTRTITKALELGPFDIGNITKIVADDSSTVTISSNPGLGWLTLTAVTTCTLVSLVLAYRASTRVQAKR